VSACGVVCALSCCVPRTVHPSFLPSSFPNLTKCSSWVVDTLGVCRYESVDDTSDLHAPALSRPHDEDTAVSSFHTSPTHRPGTAASASSGTPSPPRQRRPSLVRRILSMGGLVQDVQCTEIAAASRMLLTEVGMDSAVNTSLWRAVSVHDASDEEGESSGEGEQGDGTFFGPGVVKGAEALADEGFASGDSVSVAVTPNFSLPHTPSPGTCTTATGVGAAGLSPMGNTTATAHAAPAHGDSLPPFVRVTTSSHTPSAAPAHRVAHALGDLRAGRTSNEHLAARPPIMGLLVRVRDARRLWSGRTGHVPGIARSATHRGSSRRTRTKKMVHVDLTRCSPQQSSRSSRSRWPGTRAFFAAHARLSGFRGVAAATDVDSSRPTKALTTAQLKERLQAAGGNMGPSSHSELDEGTTMAPPMLQVRGATVSRSAAQETRSVDPHAESMAWGPLAAERRVGLDSHADATPEVAIMEGKGKEVAVDMSMRTEPLQGAVEGGDGDMEGELYWHTVGGVAPEFVIVHSRELFLGFWKECQAAIAFLVMYSWFVVVGAFGMRAWCIRYIHNVLKWYGWIVLC